MDYRFEVDGADVPWNVTRVRGEERIHAPFRFEVTCVAQDGEGAPARVDTDALLTKKAKLTWAFTDGERVVEALVDTVECDGPAVRFTLVPKLALLDDTVDHLVFCDRTAIEIITAVLAEHGISVDDRVRRLPAKRAQCVQAWESDLAFVSRLCAEEGISYYLPIEEPDVIVLADDPSCFTDVSGIDALVVREHGGLVSEESVTSAILRRNVVPDKLSLCDYNFEKPQLDLGVKADAGSGGKLQIYEQPGGYDNPALGEELATLRLAQARARRTELNARTSSRRLAPGYIVKLDDPSREAVSVRWLIVELLHEGSPTGASMGGLAYEASFVAVPAGDGYREPRAKAPKLGGVQTATATGAPGSEIHPDAYGRVKVLHRWDRRGSEDDTSSTFVRVIQPPTSGSFLQPRVGWEVLVGFHGTSADAPVVVGRLYNGETPPPSGLPGKKVVSSFGTQTTPGGGSANLISMNDTAGNEGLSFSASKDFNERTENDKNTKITADDTWSVGAARKLIVGQVLSQKVGGAQSYMIGGSRTVNVTSNKMINASSESVVIGGLRSFNVGGDYSASCATLTRLVGGARAELGIEHSNRAVKGVSTVLVGGSWNTVAGASANVSVMGASTELVSGAKTIKASRVAFSVKGILKETLASRSINAGADREEGFGTIGSYSIGGSASITGSDVTVKATTSITIKAGGVTIKMTPSSITIEGDVKSSIAGVDSGDINYG